jgi:Carbohydrate esterase, sialic acid-specific acetylesterase
MRWLFYFTTITLCLTACSKHSAVTGRTAFFPRQQKTIMQHTNNSKLWVFILAGQSNMAGRGLVEPADTIPNKRILTINKCGELIIAKEPLHFYEPLLTGLDCGLSFAKAVLKKAPSDVSILLLPVAVGGSSIIQWINDSIHRSVKLYSNYLEKVAIANKYGAVKAILWHQGESDANNNDILLYKERLNTLFTKYRYDAGNTTLPILTGELGYFEKYQPWFGKINTVLHQYAASDTNTGIISAKNLHHKGDSLHFNSKAQRLLGKRFAKLYTDKFMPLTKD